MEFKGYGITPGGELKQNLAEEAAKTKAEDQTAMKAEYKNRDNDAILSLDLNLSQQDRERNRNFHEQGGPFPHIREKLGQAKEKIKAYGKSLREKIHLPKSEVLSVIPQEETTRGRYEALLAKAQAAEQLAEQRLSQVEQLGQTLEQQQEIIAELGDEWTNQHEGDYETLATPAAESEDENPYRENKDPGVEWTDEQSEDKEPKVTAINQREQRETTEGRRQTYKRFAEYLKALGIANSEMINDFQNGKVSKENLQNGLRIIDGLKNIGVMAEKLTLLQNTAKLIHKDLNNRQAQRTQAA